MSRRRAICTIYIKYLSSFKFTIQLSLLNESTVIATVMSKAHFCKTTVLESLPQSAVHTQMNEVLYPYLRTFILNF